MTSNVISGEEWAHTKDMKKSKLSPIEVKKQKGQGLMISEIIGKIDKSNEKTCLLLSKEQ